MVGVFKKLSAKRILDEQIVHPIYNFLPQKVDCIMTQQKLQNYVVIKFIKTLVPDQTEVNFNFNLT